MSLTSDLGGPERLNRLLEHGSAVGRQLHRVRNLSLDSYLVSLFDDLPPSASSSLDKLAAGLHSAFRAQGRTDADALCGAFVERPVLQQADHSSLILDVETFLNNFLFDRSAHLAGRTSALTSQCSTVACFSRRIPPTGPVFLATRGKRFNVFGRSKRSYKGSNFCTLTGPVKTHLQLIQGRPESDALLDRIRNRTFCDGPTAYQQLNDELWAGLDLDGGVVRAQVDEAATSEVLALHVEDPASPLHRLWFDPGLRTTFLRVKQEVINSSVNLAINRAVPDWLWLRRGERLVPIQLDQQSDRVQVLFQSGEPAGLTWSPAPLAAALRTGQAFGDRIASYLVRCLLPGAVAIGGTVQQDYVEAYQTIVRETDRVMPFLTNAERLTATWPTLSRLGGAPLLEVQANDETTLAHLGPGVDLVGWASSFVDRPVGHTIGELRCAWFYDALLERAAARQGTSSTRHANGGIPQ